MTGVLHVKHTPRLLVLLALGCTPTRSNPPPPPPPTAIPTDDLPRPVPAPPEPAHEDRVDWSDGLSGDPLDAAAMTRLQNDLQSARGEVAAHAAFMLGRRAPFAQLQAVIAILPPVTAPAFARGLCGRPREPLTLSLGPLRRLLHQEDTRLGIATAIGRLRLPLDPEDQHLVAAFLVGATAEEQMAGARLLASPNAPIPRIPVLTALSAIPFAAALKSLGERTDVELIVFENLLMTLRDRAAADPRAWGNTVLAAIELAKTRPELLLPLRTLWADWQGLSWGDPGVDGATRCAMARRLSPTLADPSFANCATGEHAWHALVAQADWIADHPDDPQAVPVLRGLAQRAAQDARVLESVASAAVALPLAPVRTIVQSLAASTDPGVLAALLEGMTLHVQHARGLPVAQRDALLQRPFELPEPVSLEARQHAIALRRALGLAMPAVQTSVRAIQSSLNPDGGIGPTPATEATARIKGTLQITTSQGVVRIRIDDRDAPASLARVVEAARAHRYDGTTIHRVVPSFVAQGGDPRGDGYGGTDQITVTQVGPSQFRRGAVGIALAGPDTGGMQFFVMLADAPHLDARYPQIGRVVEGMSVAERWMIGDTLQRVEFVADGVTAADPPAGPAGQRVPAP